jgi:hypothetical protein
MNDSEITTWPLFSNGEILVAKENQSAESLVNKGF